MKPTELKDGVLVWADRHPDSFPTLSHYKMWKARYLGQPVQAKTARKIAREQTGASLVFSEDRKYKNAAPSNLSARFKRPLNKNNTSGCCGVHQCKDSGQWKASIYEDGKRKHLGRFTSKDDAIAARKEYEQKLGYPAGYGQPSVDH